MRNPWRSASTASCCARATATICACCRTGSTHAWVQVYLPSAGWIEFDPTNGIVGTRDLVRVAVARDPRQAIPLHGTYLGSADAFVGMEISINVVSAGEEAKV